MIIKPTPRLDLDGAAVLLCKSTKSHPEWRRDEHN